MDELDLIRVLEPRHLVDFILIDRRQYTCKKQTCNKDITFSRKPFRIHSYARFPVISRRAPDGEIASDDGRNQTTFF